MPIYEKPTYYDADSRNFLEEEKNFLLDLIKTYSICSVTDVGCGTGRLLLSVINKIQYAIGIDNNNNMINQFYLNKKAVDINNKIKIISSDIRKNFSITKTDLVLLSFNFLHHFTENDDWEKIIKNSSNILKNNGIMVLDLTLGTTNPANYKKDLEVNYKNGVLTREQYLQYENDNETKKKLVYKEYNSNQELVNEEIIEIVFSKIKWNVLHKSISQNGLKIIQIKVGYDSFSPSNKIIIILQKTNPIYLTNVINNSYENQIYSLAKSTTFLPKKTWNENSYDMILNGLRSLKWSYIGIINSEKELLSYIDYKHKTNEIIEIGFCMTKLNSRGLGLMTHLIYHLCLKYPDKDITIGTYQNNHAMNKVITNLNFKLIHTVQDRVDGQKSLYFKKDSYIQHD